MDAWHAKQPETRLVDWHWVKQRELVTLSCWHWAYFDRLCRLNNWTAEDLHRDISAKYPFEGTESLHWSIGHYLDLCWDHYRIKRDKLANDNYSWRAMRRRLREGRLLEILEEAAPRAREAFRRAAPVRHHFPTIRYSPFKPIARPRQLRPEAEIRNPFGEAR